MESEEQILSVVNVILSNGIGVDPDHINECQELNRQFQSTIDSFQWSLDYLPRALLPKPALYAILILRDWARNKWEEIEGSASQLYEVLFSMVAKFASFGPVFKYALFEIQSLVVMKVYPEPVSDFFQQLLAFPPDFVLQFLDVFFTNVKFDTEAQEKILSAMEGDGSNQALLQFVLDGIVAGKSECIGILVDMLTWVNPASVFEHPAFDVIIEAITAEPEESDKVEVIQYTKKKVINEEEDAEEELEDELANTVVQMPNSKCENALKVIDGLLGSPMDPSELLALIQSKEIIPRIKSVQSTNPVILSLIGGIISDLGNRLLSTFNEVPADCLEVSLSLLSSEDELIAETVLPFLKSCALSKTDQSAQPTVLQALFQRYVMYYDQEPLELNDFSEEILKIILKIQMTNSELFDGFVQEACSSASGDTLGLIAALLHIMQQVRSKNLSKPLIEMFAFLLEGVPVPCERIQYLALTQYVEFVIKKCGGELPQEVFDVIATHAVCEEEPEEYADMFGKLLLQMLKLKITVQPEIATQLVATGNMKYISIAAKMTRFIPPEVQVQAFTECIGGLDSVEGYLEFIDGLPAAKTPVDIELATQLVNQFIETIVQEEAPDSIFARSISSIWNLLGENCFEQFCELSQHASQMESIAQVCRIGNLLVDKKPESEWIQQLFGPITDTLAATIPEVNDWTDVSEETKLAKEFVNQYFRFARSAFKFLETPVPILNIVLLICNEYIQVLDISKHALSFITLLTDEEFGALLSTSELFEVMHATIICVTNDDFDPNNASWRSLMRQAMKIQGRAYPANPAQLNQMVAAWIAETGTPEAAELIGEWTELVERGVSQIDAMVGAFYGHFFASLHPQE